MNKYYLPMYELEHLLPLPVIVGSFAALMIIALTLFVLRKKRKFKNFSFSLISAIIIFPAIIFGATDGAFIKHQKQDNFSELYEQIEQKHPDLRVSIFDGSIDAKPADYKIAECNTDTEDPFTVGGYVRKENNKYVAEITRTLDKENSRCEYTVKYAEHPIDYEPENKMIQTL